MVPLASWPHPVSFQGGEGLNFISPYGIPDGFWAALGVVQDALAKLLAEVVLSSACLDIKLLVSVAEGDDVIQLAGVADVEVIEVVEQISFALVGWVQVLP